MRGVVVFLASVTDQLEWWRGVGRLLVDLALVAAMFWVVLAISGHPVTFPGRSPRRRTTTDRNSGARGRNGRGGADVEEDSGAEPSHRSAPDHTEPYLAHLDRMHSLRVSLELQGATVVLIVFAVILLAFNGFLATSEVATILAGITGYVLGARIAPAAAASTPATTTTTTTAGPPTQNGSPGGTPPTNGATPATETRTTVTSL
jgi:hypothetical protein